MTACLGPHSRLGTGSLPQGGSLHTQTALTGRSIAHGHHLKSNVCKMFTQIEASVIN